jgi:hypothetical protein
LFKTSIGYPISTYVSHHLMADKNFVRPHVGSLMIVVNGT